MGNELIEAFRKEFGEEIKVAVQKEMEASLIKFASVVQEAVSERINRALSGNVAGLFLDANQVASPVTTQPKPLRKRRRKHNKWATCYYPGCTNPAAARHGMFCAQLHKNLPVETKQHYRTEHGQKEAAKS